MAVLRSGHARRRADGGDAAAEFSRWFTCTAGTLNEAPGRRWSSCLADVMTTVLDQPTDDAYLRRVAKGERRPQRDMVYRLGEGLRAAGLTWCSGVLALRAHPLYVIDAFGILDIAAGDSQETYGLADDWEGYARMLVSFESGLQGHLPAAQQARSIAAFRKMLEPVSHALWPLFSDAWDQYRTRGVEIAHGTFGALYLIAHDHRFHLVAAHLRSIIQLSVAEKAGPLRRDMLVFQKAVERELAKLEETSK